MLFGCSAVEGFSGLLASVVGVRVSSKLPVHGVGAAASLCIEVAVGAATGVESSTDVAVGTATPRVAGVSASADQVFGGQEGVDRRTLA